MGLNGLPTTCEGAVNRFTDDRTTEVFQGGFAPGIPKHVAHDAGWLMQVLVCATSLQDVAIMGSVVRWPETGRLGLQVGGKWYVTFTWDPLAGAKEITLERH